MGKHTLVGILVGGIFALPITWIAMSDALEVGGFVVLSTAVAGLAAGLCVGALIAANFALLDLEEKEKQEAVAHRRAEARAAA